MSLRELFRRLITTSKTAKSKAAPPSTEQSGLARNSNIRPPARPQPDLDIIRHEALTEIWKNSGSASAVLHIGTTLWHGGTIENATDFRNNEALWCTRNAEEKQCYDDWARNDVKCKGLAYRLELELIQRLQMADFGGQSLHQFTFDLCHTKHDVMKNALRTWCISNDFDGVINLNRGQDEVVICHPNAALSVVSTLKL